MEKSEMQFRMIVEKMSSSQENVHEGKMMSSPGICYKKKVFAFFHQSEMTFKLGKGFEPSTVGVDEFKFLSPFKNKPPMTAWFSIDPKYMDKWETLAEIALSNIQSEVDK